MRQKSEDLKIRSAFSLVDERDVVDGVDVLRFNSSMDTVNEPDYLLNVYKEAVPIDLEVDTLVGRGVSGTIAVTHLARDLGLNSLVVRKDIGAHHAFFPVEGYLGKNWLFVDDLISSGNTFIETYKAIESIEERFGFSSTFRGAFLYENGQEYRSADGMIRRYGMGAQSEWSIEIGEKAW
jgi:adenine/guanine phosphoribosyltransferase-like PRPP-binding protein